jgi:hypothetical protein
MTAVRMLWGPATIGNVTAVSAVATSQNLLDADNAVAWAFNVPTDGTITDVGFYISAKTGTPPAYNVGIVTLDASGRPSTSAYGGSAVKSFTPTTTGWTWVTLDTGATAAVGDFAAVHVWPTGTAPSAGNYIAAVYGPVADGGVGLTYTTGWTVNQTGTAMAVKYATGAIYGYALASNTIHVTLRSNTTPDEAGSLFQLPAAMTCYGARFWATRSVWGASATAEVILYNSGGTAVATATISDKDFVDDSDYVNVHWDAVSLSALTDYRLIIKPGIAAGGDVYTPKWTFESTAALAAVPEGTRWQYTSRADAGAWTDDNVSVCPMGLWVNDITFSSGSTAYEYGYIG